MSRKSLVPLVLPADPTAALEASTKQYVDAKIQEGTAIAGGQPLGSFFYDTDAPNLTGPVTAWTALPLSGGAGIYGAPFNVPQYRLNGDVVELRGLMSLPASPDTAAGAVVATLPVGFRPPAQHRFVTISTLSGSAIDGFTPVNVTATGTVFPGSACKSYMFLDGIRFSVST